MGIEQVIGLGGKCLYPLHYLTSPSFEYSQLDPYDKPDTDVVLSESSILQEVRVKLIQMRVHLFLSNAL